MTVLDDLFRRRVLWVTGKGGVGKSTMAAALALSASERGLRTLLIDVEARGDAARFLDAGPARYAPKQAHRDLHHLALHPEEVLDEYLKVALKVPRLYRVGPVSRVFDFIATAAPGVKEVLITGKVGFEERARNGRERWDLIVVDAAPSGQIVSHLRGPRTIQEMVGVGMIRNQTTWVRDIIEDPAKTGVVVVALCEEMPTAETAELLDELPEVVKTPVLAIIANRVVETPEHAEAIAAVASLEEAGPVLGAARLVAGLAENQAPYLERLRDLGAPTLEVPLLGFEQHDLAATRLISTSLGK